MLPRSSSGIGLTALVFGFVSLALAMAVTPSASLSTYAIVSVLLLALLTITVKTAVNAQATGSLGQLLYDTEHPQSVDTGNRTKSSRVNGW